MFLDCFIANSTLFHEHVLDSEVGLWTSMTTPADACQHTQR